MSEIIIGAAVLATGGGGYLAYRKWKKPKKPKKPPKALKKLTVRVVP